MSEREPRPGEEPLEAAAAAPVYEPPSILWEQEFVPLTMLSCIPGEMDPCS